MKNSTINLQKNSVRKVKETMEKILKTCHPQFVRENDLQAATASIHAVCEFIAGKAE